MTVRGTTIIEAVVYVGLLTLIMTSAILIIFQIIAGQERVLRHILIQNEADFIIRKIDSLLPYGARVLQPLAAAHHTSLIIRSRPDNPDTTSLSLLNSKLIITRSGTSPLPLTASTLSVDALHFYITAETDTSMPILTASFIMDGEEFSFSKTLLP